MCKQGTRNAAAHYSHLVFEEAGLQCFLEQCVLVAVSSLINQTVHLMMEYSIGERLFTGAAQLALITQCNHLLRPLDEVVQLEHTRIGHIEDKVGVFQTIASVLKLG